jgi:hypothetical protein
VYVCGNTNCTHAPDTNCTGKPDLHACGINGTSLRKCLENYVTFVCRFVL